jgi:hypothetical protein
MHPALPKAALPSLGLWHFEDWDDIVAMPVPFLIERLVLVAEVLPEWAGAFDGLEASEHWMAPFRRTLAGHLGVSAAAMSQDSDGKSAGWGWKSGDNKPVVVYVSKQLDATGPKMQETDHTQLVSALLKLGKDHGYEVHVVDAQTPWEQRMHAIVRATVRVRFGSLSAVDSSASKIVLGVTGDALTDGVYMRPSPHATLMEFFPPSIFMHDMEIPTRTLGVSYMAWWKDQSVCFFVGRLRLIADLKYRSFSGKKLPTPNLPQDYAAWTSQQISVDAKAVARAVHEALSQS